MSDRELLELAAKAAGISGRWVEDYEGDYYYQGNTAGILREPKDGPSNVWNPLTDDGDAFQLAVELNIGFEFLEQHDVNFVSAQQSHFSSDRLDECAEIYHNNSDKLEKTRLAIVRAAAEIGMSME